MTTADLYELDFAAWAEENAELLRAGRFSEIDLENVAEEIGDLAKRRRDALRSRLKRLTQHLLKWQFQPEKRGRSWQKTIVEQRDAISLLLNENPSLKPGFDGLLGQAYTLAAKLAAIEIGGDVKSLPESCPYTPEQLLDVDFLP